MKYIVSITGTDNSNTLTQNTIVDDDTIVKLNESSHVLLLDIVRAFSKAIQDHVTEYRNNTVWGWGDSPIDDWTPLVEYISKNTYVKLTNDKLNLSSWNAIESALSDLIPSYYQVSVSDILSIEIYPIQNIEKVL